LPRIDAMAFSGTGLIELILPASVEVLGDGCFSECKSLSSIIFESGSKLSRIEKWAFCQTGLIEIILPVSVEVLSEACFADASQNAAPFPLLSFNQCRNCHESKGEHSFKLAWLKSFFRHRLKF
jgi:hypothetical protein